MCVGLVFLVYSVSLNILSYEMCETWPPEFRGNKLTGLEVARMANSLMVITSGKDEVAKGAIWGNIDMTFVGQNVVIKLPVGEA